MTGQGHGQGPGWARWNHRPWKQWNCGTGGSGKERGINRWAHI